MNVEIVEFYTKERDDKKQILNGSMHVYIADLDVNLRGVLVRKRKNYWFIGLPVMNSIDPETKEKVRFPVFTFTSMEKTDELKKIIREKGRTYIEQNVLEQVYV